MSLWGRFTSLFVPRGQPLARSRRREVDPDGPRQDRPLPTYSRTRWYQDDLEAAILQADGGNLALAAQLCAAFSRDGTIAGLGSTRTGGLTRLPKRFRGTEAVIAELANTAEVGLGRFDRMFPPGELAQFMLDRIASGTGARVLVGSGEAICRAVTAVGTGVLNPTDVEPIPMTFTALVVAPVQRVIAITVDTKTAITAVVVPRATKLST